MVAFSCLQAWINCLSSAKRVLQTDTDIPVVMNDFIPLWQPSLVWLCQMLLLILVCYIGRMLMLILPFIYTGSGILCTLVYHLWTPGYKTIPVNPSDKPFLARRITTKPTTFTTWCATGMSTTRCTIMWAIIK